MLDESMRFLIQKLAASTVDRCPSIRSRTMISRPACCTGWWSRRISASGPSISIFALLIALLDGNLTPSPHFSPAVAYLLQRHRPTW